MLTNELKALRAKAFDAALEINTEGHGDAPFVLADAKLFEAYLSGADVQAVKEASVDIVENAYRSNLYGGKTGVQQSPHLYGSGQQVNTGAGGPGVVEGTALLARTPALTLPVEQAAKAVETEVKDDEPATTPKERKPREMSAKKKAKLEAEAAAKARREAKRAAKLDAAAKKAADAATVPDATADAPAGAPMANGADHIDPPQAEPVQPMAA